jgi:cell division protein FtsB
MRVLAGLLFTALLLLQFQLWVADEGYRAVWQLEGAVAAQEQENAGLRERNDQLKAEVQDLKKGLSALEERARHDLGMVGPAETFYQVVDIADLPPPQTSIEPATTEAALTR